MKIALCGTMSVGKTSIINELKKKPQFTKYKFFTERSEYLKSLGVPLNKDSTFNGQLIFMAERASELMHPNILTDRSAIDVAAFTELSKIDDKAKVGTCFLLVELAKQYDLIIYVPPIIPLKANGIRTMDKEYRKEIDTKIKQLLSHPYLTKKVYVLQSKALQDRTDEILKVIKNATIKK